MIRKISVILVLVVMSASSALAGHRKQALTASEVEKRYGVSAVAAMASKGPLGAYGPLGTLGPVGSVSKAFKGMGDWSAYSQFLTSVGGPLSAEGPLGEKGPIGSTMQDFPAVFQEDGDFAVMGNQGVLGAMGPLGPLGPMGAHGFAVDRDGHYRDRSGRVVTSVVAPFNRDCSREFELFEVLSDDAARREVNDTSWMTIGEIARVGDSVSYRVHSNAKVAQSVSILVVPEKELDVFSVEVLDRKGRVGAKSDSVQLINWIEIPVKAGADFEIRVSLGSSMQFLNHSYRLIVVGAGSSWECQN